MTVEGLIICINNFYFDAIFLRTILFPVDYILQVLGF